MLVCTFKQYNARTCSSHVLCYVVQSSGLSITREVCTLGKTSSRMEMQHFAATLPGSFQSENAHASIPYKTPRDLLALVRLCSLGYAPNVALPCLIDTSHILARLNPVLLAICLESYRLHTVLKHLRASIQEPRRTLLRQRQVEVNVEFLPEQLVDGGAVAQVHPVANGGVLLLGLALTINDVVVALGA